MTDLKNTICPFCRTAGQFVFVHGHYQCPHCKNILITCCEGSPETGRLEEKKDAAEKKLS